MDPEPPTLELLFIQVQLLSDVSDYIGITSLLLLLLFASALISASEVAYFSLTPKDLEGLKEEPNENSSRIKRLKEHPRNLLATILISNNFINIGIVILSDYLLGRMITQATLEVWSESLIASLGIDWVSISFLASITSVSITIVGVTFLLVLFGEVAPKIYANLNNVRHAKLMALPLTLLSILFSPLNSLLVGFSSSMEERIYRQRLTTNSTTDKKEIDKAIDLAVAEEADSEDVDILKGIIKFGDLITKQIMRSRIDITAIDIAADFMEVMKIVKDSGYSRIPVYEEDFDNINGILYVKDLLNYTLEKANFQWVNLIRTNTLYIPESKKIDELLKEFQLKRTHMAIVVDEYGGTQGIVTLEDVMEEVIGDIRDEFDTEDEVDYMKIDDHNYIFDGKTLLNDVARIINMDSDLFNEGRGNADSLAGLILELEGQLPRRDKEIVYKHLKFKIISVTQRRIEKINISL